MTGRQSCGTIREGEKPMPAFNNLPVGCEIPSVPDIDVVNVCSLPEMQEPESLVANVVNFPPIPAPPSIDCVDIDISVKSKDCFGVTLSIPGRFGVPSGGDCSDGKYVMSIDLPCSLVGPVVGYIDPNKARSHLDGGMTLDGRPVDIDAVPITYTPGGKSPRKTRVFGYIAEERFIALRRC